MRQKGEEEESDGGIHAHACMRRGDDSKKWRTGRKWKCEKKREEHLRDRKIYDAHARKWRMEERGDLLLPLMHACACTSESAGKMRMSNLLLLSLRSHACVRMRARERASRGCEREIN